MAGRARRQKKHGILFPDGIGLFHFTEQFPGILELRFERFAHFGTHFIAAVADAGSNGSFEVLRPGPEVPPHFSRAFFHDAFQGAAPTGVEYPYRAALAVNKDDGQTIGSLDAEQNPSRLRDETVARQFSLRRVRYAMNEVRVELAKGDQLRRIRRPSEVFYKEPTIAFDRRARILFGKAKIECFRAISLRKTARPRAESVNHPRNSLKRIRSQNAETGFWNRFRWHESNLI